MIFFMERFVAAQLSTWTGFHLLGNAHWAHPSEKAAVEPDFFLLAFPVSVAWVKTSRTNFRRGPADFMLVSIAKG
jgi:hypothetical protein